MSTEPLDDLHITGRVARERDRYRAERDQARGRYADALIANRDLASELAAARNLIDEILGKFNPTDPAEPHGRYAAVETAAMVEHWRKRAGKLDTAAAATAIIEAHEAHRPSVVVHVDGKFGEADLKDFEDQLRAAVRNARSLA